jgi:hypothetical protein
MNKDELVKDIAGFVTHCGFTLKACKGCQEELADFILSRVTAMQDEHKKTLVSVKSDLMQYWFSNSKVKQNMWIQDAQKSIDEALSIIQRRKGGK